MASIDCSANAWSSAVVLFCIGCGTYTAAALRPMADFCASNACRNSSVSTLTPGNPLLSRSSRSWVEHDVQEPQSDTAITTAWQLRAMSLIISRGATRVLVGFL